MTIISLYGMKNPDPKHRKIYDKKLIEAIAYLGDKYRLANPVKKGELDAKH
jgi:hypothetical protein